MHFVLVFGELATVGCDDEKDKFPQEKYEASWAAANGHNCDPRWACYDHFGELHDSLIFCSVWLTEPAIG